MVVCKAEEEIRCILDDFYDTKKKICVKSS